MDEQSPMIQPSTLNANRSISPQKFLDQVLHHLAHKDTGLIILVFVLAFIVRAYLMRFELFFEFDSYWHARMVSYILQGLPAPSVDPLAYYQNIHAATFGSAPLIFWYISAGFYKLFTLNSPYSIELWVFIVKILPALYGAFTCVLMYFLGKELFKGHAHEKEAGLLAGLFAAVVPSFVYRTMGGFFEDDSLGFFWMVLGFIFFVRATRSGELKKEQLFNAVLAGASFALMAFTWSAFNMLVPILLGVIVVEFMAWLRAEEFSKAKNVGILWIISFIIMGVGATIQYNFGWLDQFGGILGALLIGNSELVKAPHVIAFLAVIGIILALIMRGAKRHQISPAIIQTATNIIIVLLILAPLLIFLLHISLRTEGVLSQTVGEESDGSNYFGNKYSFMIIFAMIGLPACGYLLLKRGRQYSFLILPVVWLVVTFFMAWGKLKFTYYWGLPLALMSGIVCVLALKWMLAHSMRTQKVVAMLVGFLVISGIAAGTIFVTQNVPNIESSSGWKTALFWADAHLPSDAKFFNWWDEGHWISFLSNRGVIIDNRNADTSATADVAKFILSTDENEAVKIIEKYGSTHIIFGDDLLSKEASMGFFAYNITNGSDPRISGMFGVAVPCSIQTTAVTKEQSYLCGLNSFSISEYAGLPTMWQSTPNNNQQGVPYFIYRDSQNAHLYAFTQPSNQTMLVRLWMGDPSLKNFVELYRNLGGVRIYSFKPSDI